MALATFARGGALGLLTLVVERGLALATMVLLGRTLGGESYGRYSLIVAYLALFQVLADLGVEPVLLRRLTQEPRRRAHLLANALGLRLALAVASAAGAVALAPVAGIDGAGGRAAVAAGAGALLLVGQPGYRALLRAELRIGSVLLVGGTTSLLTLALVAWAALAGGGLVAVFVAGAAASVAGLGLAAIVARDLFRPRLAADLGLWRDLLAEAWPVGANLLVIVLGLRVGALLLGYARGPVEVGYLVSASRLTESLNLIADAAMLSVLPLMARLAAGSGEHLRTISRATAKGLAVALLAVILVVQPLAGEILAGLFRPEFRAAGSTLAVLAWTALLAALGTLYANLLVAVGRQAILFRLSCVVTPLQIGLQALLIARFGLIGAAVAALASSVASHVVLAMLPQTAPLVRPCMAAAAGPTALAGLLLLGSAALPVAPAVRAGALLLAFPVSLLLTGQVDGADLRALRRALRGATEPAGG